MELIKLDGSVGEGGGQILRTAISLSMITGIPFVIERIRAKRPKPGLLRQHLTAVKAGAEICGGELVGADIGSQALSYTPGKIKGGDYRFTIGTAGSCTLVLQTVLPPLWFAGCASTVFVSGGTHNPAAPPADFLIRTWLPLMQAMGAEMDIELVRHGFYPAGGGEIQARVKPIKAWQALELTSRGELVSSKAIAVVAGVAGGVAKRELDRAAALLGPIDQEIRTIASDQGPGNVLMIELCYSRLTEVFIGIGARGLSAEFVAEQVAKHAIAYREGVAVAGEHLADQLLLPMALAGSGSFTTAHLSSHFQTNLEVIEKFLPVKFMVTDLDGVKQISISKKA